MFAGSFPHFVEVDEVTFLQPVEVGDICEFSGAPDSDRTHSATSGKRMKRSSVLVAAEGFQFRGGVWAGLWGLKVVEHGRTRWDVVGCSGFDPVWIWRG